MLYTLYGIGIIFLGLFIWSFIRAIKINRLGINDWRVGDMILLVDDRLPITLCARKCNPSFEPTAVLLRWNSKEAFLRLNDGSEWFLGLKYMKNLTNDGRKTFNNMETYMRTNKIPVDVIEAPQDKTFRYNGKLLSECSVEELEEALESVLVQDDFETAAKIRDEIYIRRLKNKD